jgi:hypothetical protein
MQTLVEQVEQALNDKNTASKVYALTRQALEGAVNDLRNFKMLWSYGEVEQRTYQVYKSGTKKLRKQREHACVLAKHAKHLAHVKHDELVKQLQEQRRQETQEQKASDMRKAEHLLSDMSPDDIRVIRKYLEI